MTAVGYRMRREIQDLLPPACTPAERLVALQIADTARRDSRVSLIRKAELCTLTGLSEDGLKKALQRLLGRGLEFRVSKGKGSDGRPVYARNGEDIEYRVPFPGEFTAAYGPILGGTTVPPNGSGPPVEKPP